MPWKPSFSAIYTETEMQGRFVVLFEPTAGGGSLQLQLYFSSKIKIHFSPLFQGGYNPSQELNAELNANKNSEPNPEKSTRIHLA